MKEFRVLWFEDNIKSFDKIISNVENHVSKHGHLFMYDHYDYYTKDFDVTLFEGIYSLAFIDLNLKNGQKGIDIIDILREKGAFIDMLLYSNNATELIKLTEGGNYVENVFRHATMTGIEDKIKSVIDQVIYKEMMVIKRFEE